MRGLVLASVAVTVQVCASESVPESAVDTIFDADGSYQSIRENDRIDRAFKTTVVDVFQHPAAYRWVWTARPEDNPALALLEALEGRGVPPRIARILAHAAAHPGAAGEAMPAVELAGTVTLDATAAGTVALLPERDLWRVPVEQAGVVLGRATAIPCLAALESPQPEYPLGPLPPVLACTALQAWATR